MILTLPTRQKILQACHPAKCNAVTNCTLQILQGVPFNVHITASCVTAQVIKHKHGALGECDQMTPVVVEPQGSAALLTGVSG
jgi:hypothetical protein